MPDTLMQIRLLLCRADELRTQGQETQRKLVEIFAEIARLRAGHSHTGHRGSPGGASYARRTGSDQTEAADTQM